MAEFFSLGEGGGREATNSQEYHHHHQETTNSTHNWFLYKHHDQELSTYKGFELWQQQQQQSHHNEEEQNYQILRNPIINPFGLDIGPSHDHHHHHHHETNMMMRSSTITISCQDCGNQAKKDCQHMRCRTCCKSRGFQCQTHVKSTWVPAAKRRERQQQLSSLQQQEKEDNNKSKRQKDDSYTGLEVANNFPSKVNSTAVFQRVRMSSIEENEDQIAYQAAVNINGHIFKGILYDQGDNHEYNYMNGGDYDSSSGGDPVPRQYNLNITRTATSAANDVAVGGGGVASAMAAEGSSHFLETSLYSSVNTFVAGTQFFPPSRS
ncbi:transcription factor EXPRESSION OF TERPENOIDS 2 [Solanum lycopersicum]|uniref:Expression of terpenoids 2 n=2 Tax=Solanum lycopersicum TaxID=4081 RepID=U5L363_SOLLC|nr:transcription factor EXPRESSION OF TERPENOIDS 2 [Solanum lycopersicum]AGW27397.1 expression of terpenoids 2 [Solanum lycopersicum]